MNFDYHSFSKNHYNHSSKIFKANHLINKIMIQNIN